MKANELMEKMVLLMEEVKKLKEEEEDKKKAEELKLQIADNKSKTYSVKGSEDYNFKECEGSKKADPSDEFFSKMEELEAVNDFKECRLLGVKRCRELDLEISSLYKEISSLKSVKLKISDMLKKYDLKVEKKSIFIFHTSCSDSARGLTFLSGVLKKRGDGVEIISTSSKKSEKGWNYKIEVSPPISPFSISYAKAFGSLPSFSIEVSDSF